MNLINKVVWKNPHYKINCFVVSPKSYKVAYSKGFFITLGISTRALRFDIALIGYAFVLSLYRFNPEDPLQ